MDTFSWGLVGFAAQDRNVDLSGFVTGTDLRDSAATVAAAIKGDNTARKVALVVVTEEFATHKQASQWIGTAISKGVVVAAFGQCPIEGVRILGHSMTCAEISDALTVPVNDSIRNYVLSADGLVGTREPEPAVASDDWGFFEPEAPVFDQNRPMASPASLDEEWGESFNDVIQHTGDQGPVGANTPQTPPVHPENRLPQSGYTTGNPPLHVQNDRGAPNIAPPLPEPLEPARKTLESESDILQALAPTSLAGQGGALRNLTRSGVVIFVLAPKGGVGKTTTAVGLAERASRRAREEGIDLGVCLVDLNRGQPTNIPRRLRLTGAVESGKVPTIYNARLGGAIEYGFSSAQLLSENRPSALSEVFFDAVLSPLPSQLQGGASVAPPDLYVEAIEFATRNYGLVIADVETIKTDQSDEIFRKAVMPILESQSAFALLVVQEQADSFIDSIHRLAGELRGVYKVRPDRILSLLNAGENGSSESTEKTALLEAEMMKTTRYTGRILSDPVISNLENSGAINATPGHMKAILDQVLFETVGMPVPETIAEPSSDGFFSRLFKKKK